MSISEFYKARCTGYALILANGWFVSFYRRRPYTNLRVISFGQLFDKIIYTGKITRRL